MTGFCTGTVVRHRIGEPKQFRPEERAAAAFPIEVDVDGSPVAPPRPSAPAALRPIDIARFDFGVALKVVAALTAALRPIEVGAVANRFAFEIGLVFALLLVVVRVVAFALWPMDVGLVVEIGLAFALFFVLAPRVVAAVLWPVEDGFVAVAFGAAFGAAFAFPFGVDFVWLGARLLPVAAAAVRPTDDESADRGFGLLFESPVALPRLVAAVALRPIEDVEPDPSARRTAVPPAELCATGRTCSACTATGAAALSPPTCVAESSAPALHTRNAPPAIAAVVVNRHARPLTDDLERRSRRRSAPPPRLARGAGRGIRAVLRDSVTSRSPFRMAGVRTTPPSATASSRTARVSPSASR